MEFCGEDQKYPNGRVSGDDDRDDSDSSILSKHVAQLSEHFDTVEVFVTRHTSEGTISRYLGEGNYFARYGQVKDWVSIQERVNEDDEYH